MFIRESRVRRLVLSLPGRLRPKTVFYDRRQRSQNAVLAGWRIATSSDNVDRVWAALLRFGAPIEAMGVTRDDLTRPLGLPPRRLDVLTKISGVTFEDARADRLVQSLGALQVPFSVARRRPPTNAPSVGWRIAPIWKRSASLIWIALTDARCIGTFHCGSPGRAPHVPGHPRSQASAYNASGSRSRISPLLPLSTMGRSARRGGALANDPPAAAVALIRSAFSQAVGNPSLHPRLNEITPIDGSRSVTARWMPNSLHAQPEPLTQKFSCMTGT